MLYQTLKYKNGSIIEGIFPTLDWHKKIAAHIPHQGKTIVDVGCATGMYGILGVLEGAISTEGNDLYLPALEKANELALDWGIENKASFNVLDFKNFPLETSSYDIAYLHMVLHWVDNLIEFSDRIKLITKEYISVIYRDQNQHYTIPDNGRYFPTQEELDKLMSPFKNIHNEVLMTQDNNKAIILSIYKKNGQKISKRKNSSYKK